MEKYTAILGFISVCIGLCVAQSPPLDIVTVPESHVYAKPGDDVTLTCSGSTTDLSYYIQHRVCWQHIQGPNEIFSISRSFRLTPEALNINAIAEQNGGKKKYVFELDDKTGPAKFLLKVTGLVHSDGGLYRCVLLDSSNNELNSTSVHLTVLNPVQKVALEIHDPVSHSVLAKKTLPANENDMAIKLKPGNYMIKCTASGSNPEAVMEFKYNDNTPTYITLMNEEDKSGDRIKYKTWFSLPSFELKPMAMDQLLTCSATIPRGDYPHKTAGIKMAVRIDKPDMMCNNISRFEGDHYAKIVCNITSPGVVCDNVKWIFGEDNYELGPEQKWGDPDNSLHIIESYCESMGIDKGLEVTLDIWEVKEAHFETIFYLTYGVGSEAHRLPVQIYQKMGSASFITPLSLFIYLAVAFLTRQAFQRV